MTQFLTNNAAVSVREVTASGDGRFLRLSDKKPGEQLGGDLLTVGQVAETLAGIFGQGTCGGQDQPAAYSPPTEPGVSQRDGASDFLNNKFPGSGGVAELAEMFGVENMCPSTLAPTGKKTLPVYVHASSDSIFEDYTLVSYGSPQSGPRIVEAEIQARFEFTNSAELPIYYYIDYEKLGKYLQSPLAYGDVIEWRGRPKNNRGEWVDPPAVRIVNGKILLHGYYSGILIIRRLPIKYHVWQIIVTGTALSGGKREYKGRASAVSTTHGLGPVDQSLGESEVVDDASAQCPIDDDNPLATGASGGVIVCRKDPATDEMVCDEEASGGPVKGKDVFCFIEVRKELRQQCINDYIRDLPTEYRGVDCPDSVTPTWNSPASLNYNPALPEYYHRVKTITEPSYTYEGTTRQISDDEYEAVCCHEPEKPQCVPYCRKIKSVFHGPVEIEGGRQKYIDEYAGKTVLIPVGTKAGPCGTLTDEFVDSNSTCCAEVSALQIDTENSAETVAPSSDCIIVFTGGQRPVDVSVSGTGFWLDSAHSVKRRAQESNIIDIYTSADNCGTGEVTIDDGCSTAAWEIRSTAGSWLLDSVTPYPPSECPAQTGGTDGCISGGTRQTRTVCSASGYQACQDKLAANPDYLPFAGGQLCDTDGIAPPGSGKIWCYTVKINTYKWSC